MQSMQSIAILAQEKCPMSVCYDDHGFALYCDLLLFLSGLGSDKYLNPTRIIQNIRRQLGPLDISRTFFKFMKLFASI